MKATTLITGLLVGAAASLTIPATAQDNKGGDDVANQIINNPQPGAFSVSNTPTPAKVFRDKDVQGGHALRVVIPGADKNPWQISLSDPILKPIKKGDNLVLGFYARVEKGDKGGTTAHIANASVQLSKDPYTGIIGAPVDIGPDWKLQQVAAGVADKDYATGDLVVSLQLATGKQTLDFGPIFVLDTGQ